MTRFDLHIHTALSACGENIMSPRKILEQARAANLDLIAITDHNASTHSLLAFNLAEQYGISVIPAMEVTTREEVHLLAYFPGPAPLRQFQQLVDRHLPCLENHQEVFGWQLIYDQDNQIIEVDERLRQVGSSLGIELLAEAIHDLSGLVVPAHVFRRRFSLSSQLGMIAPDSRFDALEVSSREWRRRQFKLGDRKHGFPVITGSDSHFLEDIGRYWLELESRVGTLPELAAALATGSLNDSE